MRSSRTTRKIWLACVSMLVVVSALAAAPGTPPSLSKELATLTHAQMRDDLVFLRDVWKPQDHSFSAQQSEEFNRAVADAIAHVDDLDPVSFWMRVAQAAALAGNGHTNVNRGYPPFPGLPLMAWWFRDGLYIVETAPANSELLGARIDKIGSRSSEDALAAVRPFISGNYLRIRSISPVYLRIPALLHRVGLTDSDTTARLTVRLRSGKEKKVSLSVQAGSDPPGVDSDHWKALIPGEATAAGRWPHVLDNLKDRPDIYHKPVEIDSHWIGDGHRTLYIRSNTVVGPDGNEFSPQLQLARLLDSEIFPNRPQAVILDLRLNSGGNFINTILFAQALPQLIAPGGKVLVLVSASTFSAAIVTAAMLKEYGGSSVLFLGTDMGDNDRFYAEGSRVPLPNSKLGVRASSGLHDWAGGCTDLPRCFWPAAVWGPQKGKISLRADVQIDPTFADYAAGRDPVMEKALQLTAANGQ